MRHKKRLEGGGDGEQGKVFGMEKEGVSGRDHTDVSRAEVSIGLSSKEVPGPAADSHAYCRACSVRVDTLIVDCLPGCRAMRGTGNSYSWSFKLTSTADANSTKGRGRMPT
jgi:hypothetical protein